MEGKQRVVQRSVTWLAAWFIKGAAVWHLLCAIETLVWILIGSPTGTRAIDHCVFFLWLSSSGFFFVYRLHCVCVYLHGCRGPLQALMMFARWRASCEYFPNHMLIKMSSLQFSYRPPQLPSSSLHLSFPDDFHDTRWTHSCSTAVDLTNRSSSLFGSDLKCHTNVN